MKLLYCIILIYFFAQRVSTAITGSDVLSSLTTIVKGVGKEAINVIPTPIELLTASKEVLFGLPEEIVFELLSKLCTLYMASGTIAPRITPDINLLAFQLRTPGNVTIYPLNQAHKITEDKNYDLSKDLAIFVSGWMSNEDEDYTTAITEAFSLRGTHNFLVLDNNEYIQTLYTWSSLNTQLIGQAVALSLQNINVSPEKIHLIGHSLGAQICGATGLHYFENTGKKIARITGLDPANPCFNNGHKLPTLRAGHAYQVVVMHVNSGVLGIRDAVGDIDVYAGGVGSIQPGCHQFGCSHNRATWYFNEYILPGNERNFMCTRCTSITALNNGFCNETAIPMELEMPFDVKGIFMMPVNSASPYGQNSN